MTLEEQAQELAAATDAGAILFRLRAIRMEAMIDCINVIIAANEDMGLDTTFLRKAVEQMMFGFGERR